MKDNLYGFTTNNPFYILSFFSFLFIILYLFYKNFYDKKEIILNIKNNFFNIFLYILYVIQYNFADLRFFMNIPNFLIYFYLLFVVCIYIVSIKMNKKKNIDSIILCSYIFINIIPIILIDLKGVFKTFEWLWFAFMCNFLVLIFSYIQCLFYVIRFFYNLVFKSNKVMGLDKNLN